MQFVFVLHRGGFLVARGGHHELRAGLLGGAEVRDGQLQRHVQRAGGHRRLGQPGELASGMTIKTLEGGMVTPAQMGGTYEVNSAHVVCGNVETANATVYIIDAVLMPPSS